MEKKRFYYTGNTGIARTKGFEKKLLGEYSINIGNMCEFGCSFCYVPAITTKQKTVQSILKQGYRVGEFSSYRERENVLDTVKRDLGRLKNGTKGTVILCTTCDPCATVADALLSIEVIKLIMNSSALEVRVLSKSVLVHKIAEGLREFRGSIVYGVSTGTVSDAISSAIEDRCSPIGERVKTLHWLQDSGFRTYGMICPVLPSEILNVKKLVDQTRPEYCEHVWVEAINVRGKSLVKTYQRLANAGLENDALELKRVMGDKKTWSEYSKELFLAFQKDMAGRGQLDKLRFLQYVSKYDKDFFENQPEAVCL